MSGSTKLITNTFDRGSSKICLTGCLNSVPLEEIENYYLRGIAIDLKDETKRALWDSGIKIPCIEGDAAELNVKPTKLNARNHNYVVTSADHGITFSSEDGRPGELPLLSASSNSPVKNDTVNFDENKTKNNDIIKTNYLVNTPIISSVASHIHSYALSASGELFGFGCGSDGRLGIPYFFKKDGSKRSMKCYVSTPSRVGAVDSEFQSKRVLAISVGKYWNFAIVE